MIAVDDVINRADGSTIFLDIMKSSLANDPMWVPSQHDRSVLWWSLRLAATEDAFDTIREYIAYQAIDYIDDIYRLVAMVIYDGHHESVRILIQDGNLDVNVPYDGTPLLGIAVRATPILHVAEMVETLLGVGADRHGAASDGTTILEIAEQRHMGSYLHSDQVVRDIQVMETGRMLRMLM